MKPLRSGVVGVITRSDSKILVGNRFGRLNAWQLPQGGIDKGESPDEAIHREILEEIGSSGFPIITKSKEPLSYAFPEDLNKKISKKYRGQSMVWYLMSCSDPTSIDLRNAKDKEFDKLMWCSPKEVLEKIIPWKLEFYKKGFETLGIKYESH